MFTLAPKVWLQLFEVKHEDSAISVIRFYVDEFASAQHTRSAIIINIGDAITI